MPFDPTPLEPIPHAWAKINLPQHYYEALVKVRNDLASGKISEDRFNMSGWDTLYQRKLFGVCIPCGTAHCIGGWMATYMKLGPTAATYLYKDERFDRLFFGSLRAAPTLAIVAIDSFLNTGVVHWDNPKQF
jgi:hypothetical protein